MRSSAVAASLALLVRSAIALQHSSGAGNQAPIKILFENDRLLAVNKPSGIAHHGDGDSELGILSIIREQQQQNTFPYSGRLHGVHRLDRVTSGVLLLAKDSATASELVAKFQNKEVHKIYMAVTGKKPKKKQGWVKGVMKIGRRGSYKLVNDSKAAGSSGDDGESLTGKKDGGYAVTRFFTAGLGNLSLSPSLLQSEGGDAPKPKAAILFQPHTGKTHQLRVAAKSLGSPILGDDRYGGGCLAAVDDGHDWARTYLHSSAVHFQLGGEDVTIWSPPPFDHLFAPGELGEVFDQMMEKHCDCSAILGAMQRSNKLH